jgi:hypothetical protein
MSEMIFRRLLAAFGFARRDEDSAVVFNVDLGAGFLHNGANHFAAGADDFPDALDRNVHREDARRELRQFLTRFGNGALDGFENGEARLASRVENFFHHRQRQVLGFGVELNGSDAFARASHLEVHVAVEVFHAYDVGQQDALFRGFAGNKTDGNTRNRSLNRHTRVHQSQCRTTNARHRSRAIGA